MGLVPRFLQYIRNNVFAGERSDHSPPTIFSRVFHGLSKFCRTFLIPVLRTNDLVNHRSTVVLNCHTLSYSMKTAHFLFRPVFTGFRCFSCPVSFIPLFHVFHASRAFWNTALSFPVSLTFQRSHIIARPRQEGSCTVHATGYHGLHAS